LLVEKQKRAQCLILGRGGNIAIAHQMSEKGGHFRFAHLFRVSQMMEANKTLDPVAIGTLRPQAIMLQSQNITNLVQQLFRLVC
jgi:hypothetical protein